MKKFFYKNLSPQLVGIKRVAMHQFVWEDFCLLNSERNAMLCHKNMKNISAVVCVSESSQTEVTHKIQFFIWFVKCLVKNFFTKPSHIGSWNAVTTPHNHTHSLSHPPHTLHTTCHATQHATTYHTCSTPLNTPPHTPHKFHHHYTSHFNKWILIPCIKI